MQIQMQVGSDAAIRRISDWVARPHYLYLHVVRSIQRYLEQHQSYLAPLVLEGLLLRHARRKPPPRFGGNNVLLSGDDSKPNASEVPTFSLSLTYFV